VFDLPALRLGRLFGIPVEVNVSWLLVFVLVASSLAFNYFAVFPEQPLWLNILIAVVSSILFFASVVLHEMSHSLVARAGGTRVRKITLFVFGGVAQMEDEPESPGREFVMALAGPAMSVAIAIVSFGAWLVLAVAGAWPALLGVLEYLWVINLGVAVFNLLPGFPLDGGRLLRAVLWRITGDVLKATRWAAMAGRFIGYALMAFALVGVVMGNFGLIWLALIGWFLTTMAEGSYRTQLARSRLHEVSVASQMSAPAIVAPGDISLQAMADDYFLGGRHSKYPVVLDGRLVGLLDMGELKRVPRALWPETRVADVMRRDVGDLIVGPEEHVDAVLGRLGGDGPGALLVISGGRLVGVITKTDVMRALRESAPQAHSPA
jgi:Zn-dependent protease/predicted transcriptional regulator